MTPIMNLMVVLIPLLLSSVQFIKLGILELNLPPSHSMSNRGTTLPQEHELKLDLSISITKHGFTISSAMAILRGETGATVSIPKKADGNFDYDTLNRQLMIIKTQIEKKFSDTNKIIIMAESEIDYQTLVSTMDAARNPFKVDTVRVDAQTQIWRPDQDLFSDVSISAGVVL
ncbi:biopolymer transporter ExbD [candidate division KSB1 bacterium]|nr:biopolymer transporter ExbD [candidate division KSB1 bacterium]